MGEDGLHAFISAADFARTMPRDIKESDANTVSQALAGALDDAVPIVEKFSTWGEMRRLRLHHPLGIDGQRTPIKN